MTKEKIIEYNKMIENREISIEVLMNCIANLEPYISKCAYKRKQYQNSDLNQYISDNYEEQFKTYITMRNIIIDTLGNPSLAEVREILKSYKKSEIVSNLIRDKVVELIKSKSYMLVE